MILTYKKFEETLNESERIWNLNEKIGNLIHAYNTESKDECAVCFPYSYTSAVSLLELILEDKNGWISYWMWELDFGKKYTDGSVTEKDGTIILLKTKKDLWNLLIREYADRKGHDFNFQSNKEYSVELNGTIHEMR